MGYIRDEIIEAAKVINASMIELTPSESEKIHVDVSNKFAQGTQDWMWEHLESKVSIQDPDAWKWINDYIKDFQVIMLFNSKEEGTVFRFFDSNEIIPILGNTSGFEFYLTDIKYNYLLCFNHHDYLIASGTAQNWLETLIKTKQ